MVTDEDISHVLFGCSFANVVWLKVRSEEVNNVTYQGSAWEILYSLVNTCTKDKLAWIVIVCWSLWNRRNRWAWDKIVGYETGVQLAAMNLLHDWKQCQPEKKVGRPVSTVIPPPQRVDESKHRCS